MLRKNKCISDPIHLNGSVLLIHYLLIFISEFHFSDEITASFRRFGHLFVDWPHKAESKSYFPPKGKSNQSQKHICSSVLAPQNNNNARFLGVFVCVCICATFPGYAFLLFQDESSVQALIDACIQEDGKLYLCVSSPTIKDKPVSMFLFHICHMLAVLLVQSTKVTQGIIDTLCHGVIWSHFRKLVSSVQLPYFGQMRALL